MSIIFPGQKAPPPANSMQTPPPVTNMTDPDMPAPLEIGKSMQTYLSNVTIEFARESETPLYQRVAAVIARLKTVDKNLQIVPAPSFSNLNPITESKNIPAKQAEFDQYFVTSTASSRNIIKLHATMQTQLRINEIKHHRPVFEHLTKNKIWIKYNSLSATDITAVAWIYDQHPDAISRSELSAMITSLLPSKFSAFQLNARQVTLSRGSSTKTRAWVMEMSRDDAGEHFGEIVQTFHMNAPIKIVPMMDPTHWDKSGIAETLYVLQNRMLRDSIVLKIDGLTGLDEAFSDESFPGVNSLRQLFMAYKTKSGQPTFRTVSQFNSKRVCLLASQANEEEAQSAIDNFLENVLLMMETEQARKHSFPGKRPIRVGKRELPAEISVYLSNLPKRITIDDADSLSVPPPCGGGGRKSYVDVARSTLSTQDSTVTSPTAIASQTTAFDLKYKEIENQMAQNQRAMVAQQQTIEQYKKETAATFESMETKLSGMLSLIERSAANQDTLQNTMTAQQHELAKVSSLLKRLIEHTGVSSPIRKQRAPRVSTEPGMWRTQKVILPLLANSAVGQR